MLTVSALPLKLETGDITPSVRCLDERPFLHSTSPHLIIDARSAASSRYVWNIALPLPVDRRYSVVMVSLALASLPAAGPRAVT